MLLTQRREPILRKTLQSVSPIGAMSSAAGGFPHWQVANLLPHYSILLYLPCLFPRRYCALSQSLNMRGVH